MSLNWHGDEVLEALRAELQRRLAAGAVLVSDHAKELVSVPGTAQAIRKLTYRYGGARRTVGKRGRVYGAAVSEPGEPPRKQFGHLRRSVAWEQEGLTARVGSNYKIARYLEFGTSRMQARPWLRRALAECRDRIRAILSKPIP